MRSLDAKSRVITFFLPRAVAAMILRADSLLIWGRRAQQLPASRKRIVASADSSEPRLCRRLRHQPVQQQQEVVMNRGGGGSRGHYKKSTTRLCRRSSGPAPPPGRAAEEVNDEQTRSLPGGGGLVVKAAGASN